MRAKYAALAVLLLTVGQLAVAVFIPGLERFEGKAFGARLVAYPIMMLVVPAGWWLMNRRPKGGAGERPRVPWTAFTLIMLPFLIDVTGNTFDLYDTVDWFDDALHFGNWALLCGGIGLLIRDGLPQTWHRVMMITGIGAILAIAWEIGEWYTFIRHGPALDTAYTDTLGDVTLRTTGALLAGFVVGRRSRGATAMTDVRAMRAG